MLYLGGILTAEVIEVRGKCMIFISTWGLLVSYRVVFVFGGGRSSAVA